jgi:hypothetical protein
VLLVSLPLLYVALFGPAVWLVDREVLPRSGTARLYRPLVRRAHSDGALGSALTWYGRLGEKTRWKRGVTLGWRREDVLAQMTDDLDFHDLIESLRASGELPP